MMHRKLEMRRTILIAFMSLVSLVTVSGCGDAGKDRAKVFPVTGTVTRGGKPIENAQVAFISPDAARNATGQTDAQGKFKLTTFEPGDGAIKGDHVVIVSKAAGGAAPSGPMTPEQMTKMAAGGQMVTPKADESIPAKYTDPKTSTLKVTVKGEGKDDFPLDLVD